MRNCLLALALLMMSAPSMAGSIKAPGVTIPLSLYLTHGSYLYKEDDPKDIDTSSDMYIDALVGIGYMFSQRIYFGAKYVHKQRTGSSTSEDDDDERKTSFVDKSTGYGYSLGYFADSGLALQASYLMSYGSLYESESKDEDGTSTYTSEELEGSAYIAEIGWMFMLGDLGLGPNFVYATYNHKKREAVSKDEDGDKTESESEGSYSDTEFKPYFGVWLSF